MDETMLIQEIQSAVKSENAILGYRKSLQYLKSGSPKMVVMANNIQDNKKREIEHDAKIGNTSLEVFDGSSKDLGVICGKPFPVSVIVIK